MAESGGAEGPVARSRSLWIWRALAVVGLMGVAVAAFFVTRSIDARGERVAPVADRPRLESGENSSTTTTKADDSDVAQAAPRETSTGGGSGSFDLEEQAEVARDAAIAFYTFSWEPKPELRIDELIMSEARPNMLGQILHTEFYSRDCEQEVARSEVQIELSDPPFFVVDMDYQVTCPEDLAPEDLPRDYLDGSLLPLEYSDQVGVTVSLGPNDRYWATRVEKLSR